MRELSEKSKTLELKLVGTTEYHVKDSKDFVQFARDLSLADDETMVSFDVKSLFTSVPTDVACDIVKKRLEAEMEKADSSVRAQTAMDVDDIMILLRLCLNTTYFQVNGKFYKQKQGTAMGSPVSVVIANLFMEELEQKSLETRDAEPEPEPEPEPPEPTDFGRSRSRSRSRQKRGGSGSEKGYNCGKKKQNESEITRNSRTNSLPKFYINNFRTSAINYLKFS